MYNFWGFYIGLPNEGYTYDAIGNRLGSRHQPGSWQYNGQDQLMSWGTGSQAEVLSYTATGQLKQNKKALETLDYDYDATDRLTEVKRNDITLANYQYDPFGRCMSKEVNGERTYYLYSDEGLIAELNAQGNTEVAYGWMPDSTWGTNPLWQANLTTGQTLKNAAYHYLHTDHLGTPQIATNQAGNITWQAEAEAFGETHLNESNQITMNLRFPGQYYDAETDTHYNYFRDYNPRTGRYQQSDPIGLGGGMNNYVYPWEPIQIMDPLGLKALTKNCCERFKDLIEHDDQQSKATGTTCSANYNPFSFKDEMLGLNCDFESIGGAVDIDWMLRSSEFSLGSLPLVSNIIYFGGKGSWNIANFTSPTKNMWGEGHRNAPDAARYWMRSGLPLRQMFPQAIDDCASKFGGHIGEPKPIVTPKSKFPPTDFYFQPLI